MRDGRRLTVMGAAENNLRDVDAVLPGGVTAVVGVSGSGKSSLVFDTIYHEARRRFLETVSLGSPRLRSRPARVRDIQGLSPAVAVAQNAVNLNPSSTVATAVGVHPFLRILFARFAHRHCPACGEPATITTLDGQVAALRDHPGPRRPGRIAGLGRAGRLRPDRRAATASHVGRPGADRP